MGWNRGEAERVMFPVMTSLKLLYRPGTGMTGLILLPHKSTFMRKRESARLIRVEYWIRRERVLLHCEPWINFPSDELVAKLMLLPPEVIENV